MALLALAAILPVAGLIWYLAAPDTREASGPPAVTVQPAAVLAPPSSPASTTANTNSASAPALPPNGVPSPPLADAAATIPAPPPPAPPPGHPRFHIETANEQRILDHVATERTIFRFSSNPRIVVLDFPTLLEQGRMLNRVAALVEKAGLPRDRVLTGVELDSAIRGNGDTMETFYYGHDYDARALAKFFSLADRDNIRLVDDEETLRRLLTQEGWLEPGIRNGLLSVPQITVDERITREVRTVILRHELSHGEYFTNPEYASFVHRFWTQTLTVGEKERIRRYLRSQGYDSSLDDVIENEAQAYLMFTDSANFFKPGMIGMTRARLTELRAGFARAMPGGWLKDALAQGIAAQSGGNPASVPPSPAAADTPPSGKPATGAARP